MKFIIYFFPFCPVETAIHRVIIAPLLLKTVWQKRSEGRERHQSYLEEKDLRVSSEGILASLSQTFGLLVQMHHRSEGDLFFFLSFCMPDEDMSWWHRQGEVLTNMD